MLDGIYQSAICFYMGYLLVAPATPLAESGRGVEDRERMGVFIACATIAVVNSYIMLNCYRWDWLITLVAVLSILMIWTWTGIYSSFKASFGFYEAATQVYGTLNFWAVTLLIIVACLLPRFSIKFIQKYFFPRDVDIIREQVRQGKFDYLDRYEAYVPPDASFSAKPPGNAGEQKEYQPSGAARKSSMPESQRPIYPPSEAPTSTTRNPRSQTGSDGTDKTRLSVDVSAPVPIRPSMDRAHSSIERAQQSMDKLRPSYEGARDFTSAALLTRIESTQSQSHSPAAPTSKRRQDITSELE